MSGFKKLLLVTLAATGLFGLSLVIPTKYVLISPGSAQDLRQLVTIEGADTEDPGRFFLVTVSQTQARVLQAIYGLIHPHIDLQPSSDVIPPGMDQQQYRELLRQWMVESKMTAQVIALRRAGFQVDIISRGILVVDFVPGSTSLGILEEGDIIVSVDGERVNLANEVIAAVQSRQVGDTVELTVLRNEKEITRTIVTMPHPNNPDLPALGLYIQTLQLEPVLPIRVQLETGQIGGPSAGLMFVLEILNQLSPRDLSAGRFIAGTGTIDLNEKVGRIGGVFQKVIAAEKAGAEYFLVPAENYEDAKRAARRIKIVPVRTLEEALDFLDTLRPSSSSIESIYPEAA